MRLAHYIRHGHWPKPVVANYTNYPCWICDAELINAALERQMAFDRSVLDWNRHAEEMIRKRSSQTGG